MSSEIKGTLCQCTSCDSFRSSVNTGAFDLQSFQYNFNFPKIAKRQKSDEPGVNLAAIVAVFEKQQKTGKGSVQRRSTEVIRFLTYMDFNIGESSELSLNDLIAICEYLYEDNLEEVISSDDLAADFLRRICTLFVYCWEALRNDKAEAELPARKLRQFLAHIISFPIVDKQVVSVFSSKEFWPQVGPLKVIEKICEERLICIDAVSLLCNLTRIEGFVDFLNKNTCCIQKIKDQFWDSFRVIQEADELGGLLLHLLVNLTVLDGFAKYIIDSNSGYFINVVLLDLISNPNISDTLSLAIWPFLKNLSILDEGRESIMKSIDIYLGPILYPIAGPEQLTDEEMGNLPLEVQFLPDTKRRVENKMIRECILDILYSLCRFKRDRIVLRDMDAYQILKHYHLAEQDSQLTEKIEDIVNILIRKENSEIEVDDLLDGLSINHKFKDPEQPAITSS